MTIRHGTTAWTIFLTRPLDSTNATSIENRIPMVCTALQRVITSADPIGSSVHPTNPLRREALVSASSTDEATMVCVRALIRSITYGF